MKIEEYMNDGACDQAQAALAFLRYMEIDESWDKERRGYAAEIHVARWENCREQGYVVMLRTGRKQNNIAFFEHRNSDSICAVELEQLTINAPTIDTAQFGKIHKDKYDVSKSLPHGDVLSMAKWIHERMTQFYLDNNPEKQ